MPFQDGSTVPGWLVIPSGLRYNRPVLGMMTRNAVWIAALLSSFVLSASLDNIPDPPSTAARIGPAHHFRVVSAHRAGPIAVAQAVVAHAPSFGPNLAEHVLAVLPAALPSTAVLPRAADSSPPVPTL